MRHGRGKCPTSGKKTPGKRIERQETAKEHGEDVRSSRIVKKKQEKNQQCIQEKGGLGEENTKEKEE
jgi:hypothetical protein